jgi:hypothetical protein
MKIKILRNTVVNGAPVEIGAVVDAPKADAQRLVLMGKALALEPETQEPVAGTETAEAGPAENAALAPARRGRKARGAE